jgi:hypothetical protein
VRRRERKWSGVAGAGLPAVALAKAGRPGFRPRETRQTRDARVFAQGHRFAGIGLVGTHRGDAPQLHQTPGPRPQTQPIHPSQPERYLPTFATCASRGLSPSYAEIPIPPMKHHVLLGLILGLLATGKLGGQVLNLFEVQLNPAAKTLTITPTGNAPVISAPAVPVSNSQEGITFLNLLSANSTVPNELPTFSSPSNNTQIPGVNENSNALFVYKYTPGVDPNPTTYTRLGGDFNQVSQGLNAYDIFAEGSVAYRSTELETDDPYGNPSNPGKNLTLYSSLGDIYDLIAFYEIRFAQPGSNPSLTINFPSTFQISGDLSGGPYLVYAGRNSVNTSGAAAPENTSLLGTYTLTVVPEPSTYAAIAGGLGLVAAVLHRRRQRARATAA